jgi:hypothetical protein
VDVKNYAQDFLLSCSDHKYQPYDFSISQSRNLPTSNNYYHRTTRHNNMVATSINNQSTEGDDCVSAPAIITSASASRTSPFPSSSFPCHRLYYLPTSMPSLLLPSSSTVSTLEIVGRALAIIDVSVLSLILVGDEDEDAYLDRPGAKLLPRQ